MIVQDLKEWGDIRYIYNSIMISDLLVGPKYHTCIVYSWLIPVRPLGSIGPQPLLASRLFSLTGLRLILPPLPLTPPMFSRFAFDLPTFRFPWVFQSSACLVMFSVDLRRVWHIHPHFLLCFNVDGILFGLFPV